MSDLDSAAPFSLPDGSSSPVYRAMVFIFISILVVYGNSLHCAWHYDDLLNIVDNPVIHMQTLDLQTITQVLINGDQRPGKISRPLAYLSFALNYLHGGLDVFGYHVVNLCIHFLTAVVLFVLTRLLLNLPRLSPVYGHYADHIALLGAVFWALHPLNVTAVTYIVQRMASMAALFYLLALYGYVKGKLATNSWHKFAYFSTCVFAGLAALASKENAAMLPFSILLLDFFLIHGINEGLSKWLKTMVVIFVIFFFLYGIYTMTFGGVLAHYEYRPFTLIQRLLTQPRVLIFYLGLFLYPTGSRLMLLHDPMVSTGLLTPWTTLPALLLVCACVGFSLTMRKRYPLASFAMAFFFLNHLIESSFVPLEMVYEHRNYLPMVFFCTLTAIGSLHLLKRFHSSRLVYPLLIGATSFLLAANGYSTFLYNDILKTDLGLWMDNAQKAPNLSVVQNNLGNVLMAHGELEQGSQTLEKALQQDHFNNTSQKTVVLYNLGRAYEVLDGSFSERAIEAYREALHVSPNYHDALFKMALFHQKKGRFYEAEKLLEKALGTSLSDELSIVQNGLSLAQLKLGKTVQAYRNATAVLAAKPYEIAPKAILAEIYRQREQLHKSMRMWEEVLGRRPDHLGAHLSLVELHHQSGQAEKAAPHLRRILGLRPNVSFETVLAEMGESAHLTAWSYDFNRLRIAYEDHLTSVCQGGAEGN